MRPSVTTRINRFFAQYPIRRYSRGETIIVPNGTVPPVHYIVRGKVIQYIVSDSGNKTILNAFHNPAFFPVLNAVTDLPGEFYFEAITDVRIRIAPPDEVIAFLKDDPDVMFDLLVRLSSGINGILGKMAHLMAGTARSRLIFEINTMAERFGEHQEDGDKIITVTEVQLAQQTGLARETVSRELQKLKSDGMISLSKGRVTIHVSQSTGFPL